MDLTAYVKIDDLSHVMKDNGIVVPRLRGLRLMAEEQPTSKEDIEKEIESYWLWECEQLCCSNFELNSNFFCISKKTKSIEKHYLFMDGCFATGVKWNVLHGKKRKLFKFARKQVQKRVSLQFGTFNKYCGRDDVLYIHARIGGNNWNYYGGAEIEKQSWFFEKVDDAFDSTYCDIYARIGQK